ncbi:MAG: hypothetical protein JRJ84_10515 [Deltaproteobacteria bacterium]|nr:hypothetical protein [Deltaproteobacteria bacterium]
MRHTAPDPTRGDPDDGEDLEFETEEDAFDAELEIDLADEEPDGEEDFDFEDHLLDDIDITLEEDLEEPEPEDLPLLDFDDPSLVEEETDEWDLMEHDRTRAHPPPPEAIVLPWSTRAEIPVLGMDLPAVLDPTRTNSEWVVAKPPGRDQVEVLVRVGPVEVRVKLRVRVGEEPGLRLGRDVLSGRILVES